MYNVGKSHEIFAGADAFLVPSRFEPCGLTQLYSMAYGTVPIVRKTGGLADTVIETEVAEEQTGFVFGDFNVHETLIHWINDAIIRAYHVFIQSRDIWNTIQQNGMNQDLSWNKPAKEWQNIYENLLESH